MLPSPQSGSSGPLHPLRTEEDDRCLVRVCIGHQPQGVGRPCRPTAEDRNLPLSCRGVPEPTRGVLPAPVADLEAPADRIPVGIKVVADGPQAVGQLDPFGEVGLDVISEHAQLPCLP